MSKNQIKIKKIHRSESQSAEGLVIVIDVIRAFTTAAFAFASGAEKIILVKDVEEARALHKQNPDFLLMGEVDGYHIDGFHFGNSPIEFEKQDLSGKTLIQRTSSGTQGVVSCSHATHMLTSSFVIAKGTLERILALKPEVVTFEEKGSRVILHFSSYAPRSAEESKRTLTVDLTRY